MTVTTLPVRLAWVSLALAAFAAAAGLLVSGLYHDTAEMVRQARAADLVTLVAAVPTLGVGLWRARSGSARGRLLTIGALGYLAYSYAIYAFSVTINALTPVHIAILGLAAWAFVMLVFSVDGATLVQAAQARLPRRTAGGFLLLVAAAFAMLWLGQIAGAITSGTLPASVTDLNLPTTPIYALDLAFALPLMAISGAWLVRRDRRGAAATLAALAFTVLMGLSVLAIFAVDGAAGAAIEVPPLLIFALVTGIGAALIVGALVPHGVSTATNAHRAAEA